MKAKKLISLALLLAMLLGFAIPTAFADKNEIHIKDAEQLMRFSTDCTLDTFSEGLTVVLDEDIDMAGKEFYPIPTFSGVFDGAGHCIYNLKTATNGSHQGFFRYIQEKGTVKNLSIKGEVSPEGSKNQVGGIVGLNYGVVENCSFEGRVSGNSHSGGICGENQGCIKNCSAAGTVEGKRGTGGIAGKNSSLISGCSSSAEVNTSINKAALDLDELNLMDVTSLDLTKAEDPDVVTDSGGIVGFSEGVVIDCENRGPVGYQHYGYNIGGIAGRQSGYIEKCRNYGEILGRKDVGGIVGQMEPYLQLKNAVNLAGEIYALHGMVTSALSNVGDMSYYMRDALENIRIDAEDMLDKMQGKSGTTGIEPEPAAYFDTELRASSLSAVVPEQVPDTGEANPEPSPEPERFPGLDIGGMTSEEYREYLERMADEVQYLNSSMGQSAEDMAEDLKLVSQQLSNIIIIMANLLTGADRTALEDISDKLKLDDIDGRVDSCVNCGPVDGDKNVGGVSGAMGIEYDFDLEGSLTENFSRSKMLTATYQTKCVSSGNINEGSVHSKKDNAGGICGLEELGSIRDCQGYGSVKSEDGGCIGGIVGKSAAVVDKCYAMCNLDGSTNIGGIAGYGTKIRDCGSLVGIMDTTNPCCGAIAGWADVTQEDNIKNNVYVHERLGAIDGISYEGKAVREDYESFLETEGLPERFRTLSLSFMADGELIEKLEFSYGGSIDESLIPQVPEKEGFTGKWEDYDYSRLYFSDTVEADYYSRQAAIASKTQREGSPLSIVLLEGDFPENAEVLLNKYSGAGPANPDGEIFEKWVMRIEEAGEVPEGRYTVRYSAPDIKGKLSIYVYDGTQWIKQTTGRNGSYITFPASGEELVFCSAISEKESKAEVLIIIIALAAALLIVLMLIKKHRKKKAAPEAQKPESRKRKKKKAETAEDKSERETAANTKE